VSPTRHVLSFGVLWLGLVLPRAIHAEGLPIRAYSTADGLAHNAVNKIIRDTRGFLWFATDDGLSRFDGYAFTNYSVEQGLPHRRVSDLLETTRGEFWVATFGGLVRFRPDGVAGERIVYANDASPATPMFATIVPDSADPRARSLIVLLESRDGAIWCGTRNGLFRLHRSGARFTLHQVDLGLANEHPEQRFINDLVEDDHGSLWAATPSGLYRRWPDGATARYSGSGVLRYDHLHDLMKDHQGRIWVASRYDGFFRISADASRAAPTILEHHTHRGRGRSWVYQLLEAADRRFWAATNLGLLELLPQAGAGERFRLFHRGHGLSHQEVTRLAEDGAGNLWIGTWSSGAMRIARTGFVTFGRQEGVAASAEVFDDATGRVYIKASVFAAGLPGKLKASRGDELLVGRFGRFNGRGFDWFQPAAPFDWGYVGGGNVIRTRRGEWWLGGIGGLYRYGRLPAFAAIETARPIRVFSKHDGAWLQVYRLFEDSREDVWVSVFSAANGLLLWNRATDTLRDMAAVEGFPPVRDELPRAFGEDRAGNVWVGLNTGVARYRNGRFTFFTPADGLPAGSIMDVHPDAAGRLWLASSRGGLIRIEQPAADRPAVAVYTTANGLSGNGIEAIAEDRFGRIYVATGRGVDQLDPPTSRVKHFTTEDGLAPGQTFGAFRDRTGALWFATENGLSRLVPTLPERSVPPSILITGLTVAGEPHPVSAIGNVEITLPDLRPDGNQLQIDFASLRFVSGDRLRYQYRLEGADTDWSRPSARQSVGYASLAPGRYRFHVRALNADGVPSPKPAHVTFRVLPPFWRQPWFVALVLSAMAVLSCTLHRYRVRQLLELANVRTRIATDLHDDIGANLTRIAILSEVARQQAPAGDGHADAPLGSIATIARESATAMSDIVWAISPERDTLSDMVRKMRDHAEEVFESREISLALDLPDGAEPVKLGVDVRRDLYLIFKEAVNNAVRHSGCQHVSIALRIAGSRLKLEVADDGIGFDPVGERDGNGLDSMRRRAARLGGELEVDGRAGIGTTIGLTMPIVERPIARRPTSTGR
jgi:signal transduction histidine kinase/ligand-binding sensor domain-containing protein